MATFLSAHGYDPGPSQRPLTAGAIAGVLATIPAMPILVWLGSLKVEAAILHLSPALTIALGWAAMALAGAAYARLFGRAANNPHGGWLFGMVFAFALWAGGAVLVIPLASGGAAPAGKAALGVALSLLAWGLAAGILVPFVHRPLHESLKKASRHAAVGPDAAAGQSRHMREHVRSKRG
jgi:hypothetical protein